MTDSTDLTVRAVMRREVPIAAPDTSVADLARLMVEHRVPGVPVIDDGELVGIVTEADLIQREANVDTPSVLSFLDGIIELDAGTPFNEELRHVATVSELATLMLQHRINPVPVVDENRQIIGMATRTGIVELIARLESTAQ